MSGDPVDPRVRPRPGPGGADGSIPVDGHVHIHPVYVLGDFLDAAARNLAAAAGRAEYPGAGPVRGSSVRGSSVRRSSARESMGGPDGKSNGNSDERPDGRSDGDTNGNPNGRSVGVLLLSESAGVDRFRELADAAREDRKFGPWTPSQTQDPGAVLLRRDRARDDTAGATPLPDLVVVAGRQVVVRERLEVLALCTAREFPDGGSLTETIERVRAAGAVPVVPWGFGKWWFGRGKIVDDLVAGASPGDFLLGDNGIRPRYSPEPRAFRSAAARGIAVLAGSDPLPFSAQVRRPGHFGSLVQETTFDLQRPARSLASVLRGLPPGTPTFGRREPLHRFLEAQIRIRLPGG